MYTYRSRLGVFVRVVRDFTTCGVFDSLRNRTFTQYEHEGLSDRHGAPTEIDWTRVYVTKRLVSTRPIHF